ncbi:MAG: hypothetical protein LVT47_09815 [Cyanobacteria bacterium LVE1205-1]|jgi:ssRNA-specific RNase YbeY (16S rRNA maturation enzyme)
MPDADYWAATLLHEILHNLGYQHPQSKEDFITENEKIASAIADLVGCVNAT